MGLWQPRIAPIPSFSDRAEQALAAVENAAESALSNAQKNLIRGVAGNAPFLAGLMERLSDYTSEIFSSGPDACLAQLMDDTAQVAADASDQKSLMHILRRGKARLSLLVALADTGGEWPLNQVTQALSDYADLALDYAVAHLLRAAMEKGDLPWPTGLKPKGPALPPATPELAHGSGFVIMGLGKLGGRELNYSSDVDLIALFDSDQVTYQGRKSVGECFVKITRDLISIMQDRTPDGYVFRSDFRLRPDPSATPLALSLNAAEVYYQTIGQNWERSAMIKARAVAGDRATGQDFLERMRPFIWRRNLDYAAISDIHAIKSQVHSYHGHGEICVPGTDVKIGPGGIREIEFFAQINQLIFGGRQTELRMAATRDALHALVVTGHLEESAREELDSAYVFLRTLEHRLQMVRDEQTHQMPENPDAIAQIARFMGFEDSDAFQAKVLTQLQMVREHYNALPGGEATTPAPESIVGKKLKPHLLELGYADADQAARIIAGWRSGRYRAMRTPRAIGLLDNLMTPLLEAFSATSDPDKALRRFDSFLSDLPSGIQLFSLFKANPWLFRLMARIMGSAPLLADHLARNPSLLDTVLSPGFFDTLPTEDSLQESLEVHMLAARSFEDILDQSRRWLNDRRFEVGLHILEGRVDVKAAGKALSTLADMLLTTLIPAVEKNFAERHGRFPGCGLAAIAMGSYGGEELSYTSDLDIIFLYKAPGADQVSSGAKPLPPSQYFSRLGQHVITALTSPTAAGSLFEIDMRLRPSGRAGPLVVTLETFQKYQTEDAWTWEHMALTRARLVYGEAEFCDQIEHVIAETLETPREATKLRADVSDMRAKLDTQFGTTNIWDLRNVRGGLVDIEYICQFTLLAAGGNRAEHPPTMVETIASLGHAGLLEGKTAEKLAEAQTFMQTIRGILALCHGAKPEEEGFSTELRALLVEATAETSFETLKQRLEQTQQMVYGLYQQIIEA